MTRLNGNDRLGPHEARRQWRTNLAAQQRRKLRARREGDRSAWFGLGMFGLVGWSVALPTLLGIGVGLWIDAQWPSPVSWTLTFLVLGVATGALIAWRWILREGSDPAEHVPDRHARTRSLEDRTIEGRGKEPDRP